jgi:hypothetical protein
MKNYIISFLIKKKKEEEENRIINGENKVIKKNKFKFKTE